ncbi:MAG: efflux RND transporter permease subunit [Sphingomicrobium sp.]
MRSSAVPGLSTWAIAHEGWVWLLFALLLIAGGASYYQLPVKRFPTVQLPAVAVSVSGGAVAPAELERDVAVSVEAAVAKLPGIHKLWTQIAAGRSVTIVQFDSDLADENLAKRVCAAIAHLKLADGGRQLSVRRLQIESTPMLSYAVTSAIVPTPLLSAYVDQIVLPRLRMVPGIGSARRLGGSDEHLEVALQPAAMRARGVTALAASNAVERWSRAAASVRLEDVPVQARDGQFVRLGDLATVGATSEVSSHLTMDGDPAVGFTIVKAPNADALNVASAVADLATELEAERPDLAFTKGWSTADETGAVLHSTYRALVEGMVLAALVVLLFLRDLRATLVVAVAMPVSLVPTFAILAAAGFSINLVTLLALTLAVGILVDDAIVEVENIQRLVNDGVPPREAAPRGADGIALAVIATTAAIVAVFAPVSFMPGVAGRFFFEFGLTVSTAVLMSLLVARLLTPILAARILKRPAAVRHRRQGIYDRLLTQALSKPRATIIGAIGLVGASIALVPWLPTEFQPTPDPDFYFLSVVADPGEGIDGLQDLAEKASAIVAKRPETRHLAIHLGATAEGDGAAGISLGEPLLDPRSARIAVTIDPERDSSVSEIRADLRPALRRLRGGTVIAESAAGGADLRLLVSGNDPGAIAAARARMLTEMKQLPYILDARPMMQGLAQSPRATGIAPASRLDAGEQHTLLQLSTEGKYFGHARTSDGTLLPVHLRIAAANSNAVDQGELRAIILRLDGLRVEGIDADIAPDRSTGEAMAAIERLPAVRALPTGVALAPTGDEEEMERLFQSMAAALLAAAIAVYATLALLFRSFTLPLIIISALPLALGGAVLGLLLSGSALNLPALIGFLLLLGLAAKNSILLVEHAARRVREGLPVRESIVEACQKRSRAVVMTSVAMAAGMIPAALSLGAGDEFRQPMAFAVIGGLVSSTALSLLFVPAIFLVALSRKVGAKVPSPARTTR